MTTLTVRSRRGSYPVLLGGDLLRGVAAHPCVAGRACFAVTTPRVLGLHGENLLSGFSRKTRPPVLLVDEGERHKTLRTVERLARELARAGARRDAVLLAFGGGMIGDLTGFLAAVYLRGVDYVQVPTTLLAQVDASIGGKTGVDLPEGKNLLGSFCPPRAVIADTGTVQTLSARELRAGLFECVKCGIVCDAALFERMEKSCNAVLARQSAELQRVIQHTARIKAGIVSRDEHDTGERMLLNFGHTFAHALESALGYKTLLHGEAVGWGMLAALRLSARLGVLPKAEADRAACLVRAYGPLRPFDADATTVMAAMHSDKKADVSGLKFVLAETIGRGFLAAGIPDRDALAALRLTLREAAAA